MEEKQRLVEALIRRAFCAGSTPHEALLSAKRAKTIARDHELPGFIRARAHRALRRAERRVGNASTGALLALCGGSDG